MSDPKPCVHDLLNCFECEYPEAKPAPACPNAEAPKVEEPCRLPEPCDLHPRVIGAAPDNTSKLLDDLEAGMRSHFGKPAPVEKAGEEPIYWEDDFDGAVEQIVLDGEQMSDGQTERFVLRLCETILALRAEVDALKADVVWHRMGRDECRKDRAALRAEVAALKEWIRSEGERAQMCTYYALREPCPTGNCCKKRRQKEGSK